MAVASPVEGFPHPGITPKGRHPARADKEGPETDPHFRGNAGTVRPDIRPGKRPVLEDHIMLSRRRVLALGSSAFVAGTVSAPFVLRAQQAEFTYKFAN